MRLADQVAIPVPRVGCGTIVEQPVIAVEGERRCRAAAYGLQPIADCVVTVRDGQRIRSAASLRYKMATSIVGVVLDRAVELGYLSTSTCG